MDYNFASISTVDKDLKEFLESPTQEKNLALLFQPVPANHTVYMCLIQRRYEGWLKSEYFDLYLQLGGWENRWDVMKREHLSNDSTKRYLRSTDESAVFHTM